MPFNFIVLLLPSLSLVPRPHPAHVSLVGSGHETNLACTQAPPCTEKLDREEPGQEAKVKPTGHAQQPACIKRITKHLGQPRSQAFATIQFLVACSMRAQEISSHASCMTYKQVDTRRAVHDKISRGPFCNILSKDLRPEYSKGGINTAHCSVNSWLICTKFVSYNDRAPLPVFLPSVYLMSLHMTKSLRLSPPFLDTASDQKPELGKAWERGYNWGFCWHNRNVSAVHMYNRQITQQQLQCYHVWIQNWCFVVHVTQVKRITQTFEEATCP